MYNAYKSGYDTIIDKIDEIIDDQLDKNNQKLKMLKDMQQKDRSKFEKLLDETNDAADYLSGMYRVKHILMCSFGYFLARNFDQDFEAGRKTALDFIENLILNSKKWLDEVEDETKKEEDKKKITGAEYLYHCIKKDIQDIVE